VQTGRRGAARDLEQIAAAALIAYTRYVDPVTGQRCEAEQALERLIALRDRADRLAGDWAAVGFAPAKRPPVRRLLNSPKGRVRYFWRSSAAVAHARATGGKLIWWAGKETPQIRAAADAFEGPVVRMEDGFIRSRGLGSDFFGALSVALDDQGVYYDPTRPSRLESLIEAGEPSPDQAARAEALRVRVVEAGLSKYNLKGAGVPAHWPKDKPILLVVGQVENDRSIMMGCGPDLRTNSGLVKAARADHPDAFLIYRNHPDVTAGNRPRPAGPCGDGGGRRLSRRSGHRGLPERLRPAGDPDLPDRVRGPDAGQAGQRLRPPLLCRMGPDRRPPGVRAPHAPRQPAKPHPRRPDRLSGLCHAGRLAVRGRGSGRGPDRRARPSPARPAARPHQSLVARHKGQSRPQPSPGLLRTFVIATD
jgi:hypothetical protein